MTCLVLFTEYDLNLLTQPFPTYWDLEKLEE
jgi:hypothetical protein